VVEEVGVTLPEGAADRFERVLAGPTATDLAQPELLPSRWARAAASSLPVDGAGLSLYAEDGVRVPLGASDRLAARAEQLQFSYGAGPCLRAHDTGTSIAFDRAEIVRNWPGLWESLVAETTFHAVFSTPLAPPLGPSLVLDLYLRDEEQVHSLDRDEVEGVVVRLTGHAARALTSAEHGEVAWWRAPDACRRTRVWEAVGVVAVRLERDTSDALAVLKAHAVATGQVVEDVAEHVLTGQLGVLELDAAPRPD
jgi:hypothetical protein